jgi:hypothetical protein
MRGTSPGASAASSGSTTANAAAACFGETCLAEDDDFDDLGMINLFVRVQAKRRTAPTWGALRWKSPRRASLFGVSAGPGASCEK